MKRIILLTLIVLLVSAIIFGGCAAEPAEKEVTEIEILSVESGLAGYFMSFGLADIINKYSTTLHATALETIGGVNIKMMRDAPPEKQKRMVIWSTPTTNYLAKNADPSAVGEGEAPYLDCRALAHLYYTGLNFVTLDPNIKTPYDFVGKKIALFTPGSVDETTLWILDYGYELPIERKEYLEMGAGKGKDALLGGTVDVALTGNLVAGIEEWHDWLPAPATEEILTTRVTYRVNFGEEEIAKARAKGYPVYPIKGKGKEYGKSPAQDWIGWSLGLCWYVHKDMPDETVNELLTIMWDNIRDFDAYHATGKFMNHQLLSLAPCSRDEFHPAAIKFFEEKGNKVGMD